MPSQEKITQGTSSAGITRGQPVKIIKEFLFEVCGDCQRSCVFCSHGDMASVYKGYQLSIGELEKFIDYTRKSGYFIELLNIHGIGEPLLWEHFEEGIRLLRNSGIIERISVITNGFLLNKIKEETLRAIDSLRISVYPGYPHKELLRAMKQRYKDKIEIMPRNTFRIKPLKRYDRVIPGECFCRGPMFVKDKVFFYCGPPVFGAAKLKGVDILASGDLYTQLKEDYLVGFQEQNIGNLDLCSFCWANNNIKTKFYPLWFRPSKNMLILFNLLINLKSKFKVSKYYHELT
jgi:hypothetical protein